MAKIQNTAAASARFLGPQVPALRNEWHWWFQTRVDYGGPDAGITRPVVFKRLGLSVLAERSERDEVDTALHGKVKFRTPTLLKAYPSASGGTLSLLTLNKVRVSGSVRGVASADAMPIVVSPAASRWPDQELQHLLVGRINIPWMRMAQGRVAIGVPADPKNAIAKYLRLRKNGQMLDGVRVVLTGEAQKLLQIELTPEGLEFEADMPDPTVDFDPGGAETVKVIVRLEISGAGHAVLRLVGAKDSKVIDAMEGRLAAALVALQVARTPASVRFDVRPAVPSIRWLLEEKNGSLRAAGGLEQGRWSVLLDETTVDVRIVSGDFEPAAVATVGAGTVMLSRENGELSLKVNAREEKDHEVLVQFVFEDGRWVPRSETKDMAVSVDLDLPAAQLQALYTQSRALAPGEQPPFIFLPVRDGWLQAPIPRLPDPNDDTTPSPPPNPAPRLPPRVEGQPTLPVLSGRLLSQGPAFRAGRSLVVESAGHAEVTVTWRRDEPADPVAPREVTVRTWGTAGELRGYVFAAETSPTAEEGIPNLLAGEAATRDLALVFGVTRTSGRWWDARFDAKDGWHLALQLTPDPRGDSEWRAWMRDPHAGFVGIVPHTRAARGSARPSPSRDLLPLELRAAGGGTAKLLLSEAGQARVPDATYDGEVAFAEERVVPPEKPEAIFDTVMPTLPGVQFRPVMAATHPKNSLNRWTWTACWRHGLPALDEFFGSIEVPRRRADEPPMQLARPDPVVTALKPAEMQRSWLLAADRISLGWVQDRFAFAPWLAVDGAARSVDVVGWAQPYAWSTEAVISLRLGPGADDPVLGSYALGGKRYSLADALPGIGQEGVAERFAISADHHLESNEDGKVQVLGMAISSYDDGGLAMDARGLALGARFTRPAGAVLRAAKFVRTAGEAASEFSLLTLAEPLRIPVQAYLRHELAFYVRDLPVILDRGKYVFDGSSNAIESAMGAGGEAFEREHFGEGLHEWRLFESADGRPMRRYEIGWGPLSFVPLRLWKFEAKDSAQGTSIAALWVLGRLELASSMQPWEPSPSAAPFGPEEPYKAGEVFMMKLEGGNLWLEPVRVDALPGPGAAETTHRLQVSKDASASGGMATIRIDAVQHITGGGTPNNTDLMPLLVGLQPLKGGGARLQARLFGDDRMLGGTVKTFDRDLLELRFEPEGDLHGVARASTITVRIASTKKLDTTPIWNATIELGVELRIMSGDACLFWRAADGRWQWMNVLAASPVNDLRISHESGAISLHISSELSDSEPLLGWPVETLDVKGFVAQVFPAGAGWPEALADGASFLQVEARGSNGFQLRHLLEGRRQEVKLDWRATCTSVIRWPRRLTVEEYADSRDWTLHADYVRMVGIPAADVESMPVHVIELGLREQPIPLAVLGPTGEGFGITAPWAFLVGASHQLKVEGEAKSWLTLDRVEILPAAKLDAPDDAFGFAPRYRDGEYRTRQTNGDLIPHPGVARAAVAQTGFRDSSMPRAFASWRPVIRASSVTAFIYDADDIENPRGLVAQVAWLADTAEDGALQGLVLAQCQKDRALDWRFASVDAVHAAKKLFMHRQQREISLYADVDAGELDRALVAALDRGTAQIASQRPVTQAWFELFDKAKRRPKRIDELAAQEMPFFPETMLVFDKLWQSRRTRLEARTILAKGDESGDAVHVRLRKRTVPAGSEPLLVDENRDVATRLVPVRIIALDRESITITEPLTAPGAAAGNLLGSEGESGRGHARIRELVKRSMPSPRVIFARGEVDRGRTAWQLVQMPRPDDDFGAQVHVESAQPIPASAALGWPSDQSTYIAGKLGLVGGVDAPVWSSRAGFAGRESTFRLPAWAPGQDGPEALYVSFATHVAFYRPTAQVMYSGPAAKHLSTTPARLRAPLSTATKEALRKLIGIESAEQVSVAAICPPSLERTSIGDRPGELHVWTASVVVPAEDFRFDPDDMRYGRPATSGPVLARQHRAPRSPLLPADKCLSLRRRTYVSTQDKGPDGLAELKLFAGSATLFRLYDADGDIRCSLEVHSGSGNAFRLGEGWDGRLQLLLDTAPAPDRCRLAKAGLLPTDPSKSTAQIRIGNERFPLGQWSFNAASRGIILTFTADPGDALRIVAAVRATNVDVPLAFDFSLEAQAPLLADEGASVKLGAGLPAAIRRWPVRNLSIPLQRAAGARATLTVDLHTVAFADAAYDRQLAAPTFESPPTTLTDGKRLVLVTDREEYRLDDTVLLTAGVRDERVRSFAVPAGGVLRLSVQVQPRRKETDLKPPRPRELRFPQGSVPPEDFFPLTPPSVYALQPRSLVDIRGAPAELEPGDRLILTVKPPAGSNADSEKSCVLMLRLTDLPSIAPPPAVYSLVTATAAFSRATVAMHACAPLPDAVEYPSLEADLYRGMVQRRALFIWQWASVDEKASLATLVKVDRSGGAQLPRDTDDFVQLPVASVVTRE
ncbi:hypothetical protein [Thauera aminoaromatica]|uniref:Uncharacterized protein n=1 Tax=Thauera aminoaromatica TaxID=164330 RepID=A0A5C7S2V8_THASP|nr:hypothetical protein [Thauera aminoaromatica]TXH78204.1 MAG: hypothetical protein E6Q80_23210 [Thauera aminoaromatica]